MKISAPFDLLSQALGMKKGDVVHIAIRGRPQRRCWMLRGVVQSDNGGWLTVSVDGMSRMLEFDPEGNVTGHPSPVKYYIVHST
jgi:hypothetical protein